MADEFCRRRYRVFGSVRSAGDAERLRRELGDCCFPLVLDVTDRSTVEAARVTMEGLIGDQGLHGLVNNAGISISGPLTAISPALMREHFEINVVGALNTTQVFLPLLRKARTKWGTPGRIVNVSALSGRNAYPFMGPYAASKHALEAFSDSLRRELLIYGVDVIVIQPGNIDTPMWVKAAPISTAYAHTDYAPVLARIDTVREGRRSLPVSAVTSRIVKALTSRRPKARYLIPDEWFRFWIAPRLLPDRWLDFFVDRFLGFQEIRDALKQQPDDADKR